MKMTKLLAIGSAAAVAVASLASVASAAEQTFDMAITKGTIKLSTNKGNELGAQYALSQADIDAGATLGLSFDDALVVALASGSKDADKVTGVSLNVTGVKGTRTSSSKTYTYKFTQYEDAACTVNNYDGTGKYFKLDMYADKGPLDSFVPSQYVEITKIELVANGEKVVTTASDYTSWGDSVWGSYNGAALDLVSYGWKNSGTYVANDIAQLVYGMWGYNYASEKSTTNDYPFMAVTDLYNGSTNKVLSSNKMNLVGDKTLTRDEIFPLSYANAYRADNLTGYKYEYVYEVEEDVEKKDPDTGATITYPSSGDPVMEKVTVTKTTEKYDSSKKITGINVIKLYGTDGDQTYDDNNMGTNPKEFAGLASQAADFFNKQTNGTITFKFTTAAAASSTAWNNGGIPSTQVGLKNALGDATANDFALFFNYDQTGSLQAVASVDADAGEVTFDISDVLDALGGQTKGVIDNIYYGLTKGVSYDDKYMLGLKVETVTLAYDEEDDADIEDEDDTDDVEDDDDDIDDVDDEEDDDDDADDEDDDDEDDDEDVTVDDDDDTDDADDEDDSSDVAGDNNTVVVKPAGDDSNPNTGVALAVVPAAIAAAAVVVSKKRK